MSIPAFEPREGGVKIVFDVREADAAAISRTVAAAGFDVRRYYHPDDEHRLGGSPTGWLRLGAERSMREFTEAAQERIVAAFDAVQHESGLACDRVGTDSWTAGGGSGGGPAGVREPRRPVPRANIGAAVAPVPSRPAG